MNPQQQDRILLNAVCNFALSQVDTGVDRFKHSIQNWGSEWMDVGKNYLPAVENLALVTNTASAEIRDLIAAFEQQKHRLLWEQSYKKQDGVVSDAMLANYGFAEIIGSQGPFVSDCIRAGIGIYGPNIVYPRHRHQAEEIYILLSGSASYKIGDRDETLHTSGEVILVESNTEHGFRTGDEALIVYYLWQAGDLRQISSFS